MPKRPSSTANEVYQLKIILRDVRPPIWRRVLVTDATTLHQLHWIVQAAMGWTNSHLHQFIIDDEYYSQKDFELDDWGHEVKNENRVRLAALSLAPKRKFTYEYDFGDGWEHEILVEKVFTPEAGGATRNAWRANGRAHRKTAA
ncbi:MAG: plasmid pRiA4b ORF-3 family protein, partial [Pyrinomonadaceae bacterium]|nr:plasmid pRiA4b ORF-3 family protein [Pyrinomonadaceae bacterium]